MENRNLNEQNLIREISFSLSRHAGWIQFLGLALIVYGVITALSIVGLVVAWLPFWMGLLLLKAAGKARAATAYGDKYAFEESLQNIANYFIISGITILLIILALAILLTSIIFFGFSLDPESFESILS